MMKRIWKYVAAVLILLAVAGIVGICLRYQPERQVLDRTEDTLEETVPAEESSGGTDSGGKNTSGGDGDEEENELVLSSNVQLYVDDAAKEINQAIQRIYCNDENLMEITLDKDSNQDFLSMGKGDIFFLSGDENTPFGCTYIGKVVSLYAQNNKSAILVAETPSVDEVFDSMNLDVVSTLDEESLNAVSGVEGVTITYTDDVKSVYNSIPSVLTDEALTGTANVQSLSGEMRPMTYSRKNSGAAFLGLKEDIRTEDGRELRTMEIKPDGFVIQYDLDILKTVKTVKSALSQTDLSLSGEEDELSEKRNTADENLGQKVKTDLIDSFNDEPKVHLKGKAAVSNLSLNLDCDWRITDLLSKCGGFTTLAYGFGYQFATEDSLTVQAKNLEFGGTKNEFAYSDVLKLEGLNDKLIPLAFVQWAPASIVTVTAMDPNQMNNLIHINASMSPLSAALIFYLDMSGNVSVSLTMEFDYQNNFYGGCEFIRDGQWVADGFHDGDDSTSWAVDFHIAADMDAYVGLAADIYIYNISIIDINAIEYGVEGEGVGGIRIDSAHKDSPDAYADLYARGYLKFLDTHMNFRGLLTIGSKTYSAGFSKDWLLSDITHWTTGTRKETNYDKNTMFFGQVTAEDASYIYYLNESGSILKQDRSTGDYTALCSGGMAKFCGIDASYLYLMKSGDSHYDIYRVDKTTGISRKIQTEVVAVLAADRDTLYYLSAFDDTAIMALDRETLNKKEFRSFNDSVQLMDAYGDYFYVSTKESGMFSWLFGADCYYYLLDHDGNVVSELGKDPDALMLPRVAMPSYYYSAKYIDREMLRRASAEKLYWISADQGTVIETEQVSGWAEKEDGIFVTLESGKEEGPGYTIWLYQAADGQKRQIADVYSDQAFFTLCEDVAGYWYYFDDDGKNLTLYRMDGDFSGKAMVTTYDKSLVNISLSDCSMEIVENKMIFYTITGDDSSASASVLYRYDLY